MGKILDGLFEALEKGNEFEQLDRRLTEEYEVRMRAMREQISAEEYEQARDAAFSVLYLGKKEAFGIGFRAAMKMVMELSV